MARTSKTPLVSLRIDTSNVPPPRSYTAYVPSAPSSSPYATAAAVGSFSNRSTLMPASRAASFVAWRCASSKYAGTVMTAPTRSPPSACSARLRSTLRISADTSTGLLMPADVRSCSMPGRIDEVVRHVLDVLDIAHAPAHEALDGHHGVARIDRLLLVRRVADLDAVVGMEANDRRQQRASLGVVDHDRDAVAHGRDQRVGGAEVDADREPMPVRFGGLPGLGDLQQRHQADACLRVHRLVGMADLGGETVDEHELPHQRRGARPVLRLVDGVDDGAQQFVTLFVHRRPHVAERRRIAARLVEGLPPLHLLHQEGRRHGGVGLGVDRHSGALHEIRRSLLRRTQRRVRLVGPGGPLHRDSALRRRARGIAVRVHARLHFLVGALERVKVDREAGRQAEEFEVVRMRHAVGNARETARPARRWIRR